MDRVSDMVWDRFFWDRDRDREHMVQGQGVVVVVDVLKNPPFPKTPQKNPKNRANYGHFFKLFLVYVGDLYFCVFIVFCLQGLFLCLRFEATTITTILFYYYYYYNYPTGYPIRSSIPELHLGDFSESSKLFFSSFSSSPCHRFVVCHRIVSTIFSLTRSWQHLASPVRASSTLLIDFKMILDCFSRRFPHFPGLNWSGEFSTRCFSK